jgi:Flp pilus assembly protein TadD
MMQVRQHGANRGGLNAVGMSVGMNTVGMNTHDSKVARMSAHGIKATDTKMHHMKMDRIDSVKANGMRWPTLAGLAGLLSALALLPGCASNSSTSALQMMREQQAQAQAQEDAADKQKAPTKPELALSMIRQTQSQGRYFASLAYIDAYRKQFGDAPELAALRADALRMTNQPEPAEQAYRALIGTDQAGLAWRGLGLLAGARGDFAGAADDLSHAAQAFPADASVLSDLGYARLRAGDIAGARVPLGQAAELDPTNVKVLGNLALLLLADGDIAGAHRVMEQASLPDETRARVLQLAAEMQRAPVSSSGAQISADQQAQTDSAQTPTGSAQATQAQAMQTQAAQTQAAQTQATQTQAAQAQAAQAQAAQAQINRPASFMSAAQPVQPTRAVVRNMSDPATQSLNPPVATATSTTLAASDSPALASTAVQPAPVAIALPDDLQPVMARFGGRTGAP